MAHFYGCEQRKKPYGICTCDSIGPKESTVSETRIADETTKLTNFVLDIPVAVEPNPVFVYGAGGKVIGSAVLSFVNGGMQAQLILDAHNPEAFDLANEPTRCAFKLVARIIDGTMDKASLWLESK